MSDWNDENEGPPGDTEEAGTDAGGWDDTQDSPHEGEEGQAGDVA